MLKQSQVDAIVALLREGELSQRKIARQLGVSRGVVSAIARGKRGHHGGGDRTPPVNETTFEWSPCSACGGMRLPERCPRCEAEALIGRRRAELRAGVA